MPSEDSNQTANAQADLNRLWAHMLMKLVYSAAHMSDHVNPFCQASQKRDIGKQ